MKKSIKRVLSLISAVAMLSTTALVASANTTVTLGQTSNMEYTSNGLLNLADVITIKSAQKELEQAAFDYLAGVLGTSADKASILKKVDSMTKEELTVKMETVKTALIDGTEAKEAMDAALDNVDKALADIADKYSNAKVVVSDVYNPLNVITGGANITAIKTLLNDYVEKFNSDLAAVLALYADGPVVLAKGNVASGSAKLNITLVELSKIVPTKTVAAAKVVSGEATSTDLEEVSVDLVEQAKATVDTTEVAEDIEVINYGDITNDDKVTVVDAVAMIKFILEDETLETFATRGFNAKAADVKKDDKSTIDMNDLTQLKLYLLEVEGIELGK